MLWPPQAVGMLTLWFPRDLRERLLDGAVGRWRGITRMRDDLGGEGEKLEEPPYSSGQPVAYRCTGHRHARSAFSSMLSIDELGHHKIRAGLVELLSGVPTRPQRGDPSTDWSGLFSGPNRRSMVWLAPENRSVADISFSDAVESLVTPSGKVPPCGLY